jgi:hypothetical protein
MASATIGGIDACAIDFRAIRPSLSLSSRSLNWLGRHLERAGAFRNLPSPDSILERAERHGVQRYSLEQFGLTPERVDRLFPDYSREFGLSSA